MELRIVKLDERAVLPEYGSDGAGGLDLFTIPNDYVNIYPEQLMVIKTGISMAIPEGWVGIIKSRSGLAVKKGLTVEAGVIDCDYRGEILVAIRNNSGSSFLVGAEGGMKIAQMLILPAPQFKVTVVENLDDTKRGSGGFGSTGLTPGKELEELS